ncbi:MAG TPA: class I SAM-dependent methyltransferase [Blastocatellia bacterium]|jgi:caffeoyl-CoA O-methyltransferase|nr:class I SAM-dependent methyltransferase [Blastocatellia bacterium]
MANSFLGLDERIDEYLMNNSLREPDVLRRLREETVASNPHAEMAVSPIQGQFMALLVKIIGAVKTLEVGVFTGYSSLCTALALPPNGRIVACDVNEKWTSVARRYWAEAGVADKISLRLAPAIETLDEMLRDGQAGTFDFAFIDADKPNYDNYYERALKLMRRGGLIIFDNMLWSGRVADPGVQDAETVALRALNEKLHRDERVFVSLLPLRDGISLVIKQCD